MDGAVEETEWSGGLGGPEGASWRLLAALEVSTVLLVALALLLHALRTRTDTRATLRGQRVLITKGESALGRELARQFAAEGCAVSVLCATTSAAAEKEEEEEYSGAARVLRCDTSSVGHVSALAAGLDSLDVLVVCGAARGDGGDGGLHDLAAAVSEEVYSNFHLLEELGGRVRAGGRVAWVATEETAGGGGYAGAASALHDLARALLQQVADRRGCSAVWCSARGAGREALAARVVRRVARTTLPPPPAHVFREFGSKLRGAVHNCYVRLRKMWT